MKYPKYIDVMIQGLRSDEFYDALIKFVDDLEKHHTSKFGNYDVSDEDLRFANTAGFLFGDLKQRFIEIKEKANDIGKG